MSECFIRRDPEANASFVAHALATKHSVGGLFGFHFVLLSVSHRPRFAVHPHEPGIFRLPTSKTLPWTGPTAVTIRHIWRGTHSAESTLCILECRRVRSQHLGFPRLILSVLKRDQWIITSTMT